MKRFGIIVGVMLAILIGISVGSGALKQYSRELSQYFAYETIQGKFPHDRIRVLKYSERHDGIELSFVTEKGESFVAVVNNSKMVGLKEIGRRTGK